MNFRYLPCIKTTDAELKAVLHLDPIVKQGVLPVYELTKSRKTTKNINSVVENRIAQIRDIQGEYPFILDLTTEFSLQNNEIIAMLNQPQHGFKLWCEFVEKLKSREHLNVVPIIHYNPFALPDVKSEIERLHAVSSVLAFRVGVSDPDLFSYIVEIVKHIPIEQLIILLDGSFLKLPDATVGDQSALFRPFIRKILQFGKPKALGCLFSSFPASVRGEFYGHDATGDFPISEINTHRVLANEFPVICSDYAATHPLRYETRGGQWIPRVDASYVLDGNIARFFYMRVRREDGGYIVAAKRLVEDGRFQRITEIDTWGDSEILTAADGTPNGRAPAHWISVRVNNYITMQYFRLKKALHSAL